MKWRSAEPQSGVASRIVLGLILVLGFGWLTWPVWSSVTAPDRETVSSLSPALLAALLGLLLLLTWAIWRDARYRMRVFAPVVAVAGVTAAVRMFLLPRASGFEPVFALPLLAGAALGAPAGFLVGAVACLASSAAMGLISAPLIGQVLLWGLWGAAGGLLRPLADRPAWLGAVALSLPLGVLTGLGLNLTGWTGERAAEAGAFLPGVGILESLQRLWEYTQATSVTLDLTRAASSAVLAAVIGLPVIRALRTAVAPTLPLVPTEAVSRPPEISPTALQRRERSARLTALWPDPEGEPK